MLIGVGVDGYPGGRDAVVLGRLLAAASGGELLLIAVHKQPLVPLSGPQGMSWASLEKQYRVTLAEARDSLAPDARIVVQPDTLVWRGLRHVVRLEHRDLLVVGSAHDANDGCVRLGSDAGELFAHLECPLAIAPSGMRDHSWDSLKRIGVGLNGTRESRAALALAASIASGAGAELEVRRAIEDGVAGGSNSGLIEVEGDPIIQRQLLAASKRDVAATSGVGTSTNVKVKVGMPTDILSELADQVDLLVIGSGRQGPLGRVLLGGTGRALLHYAPCPLLVVPRPLTDGG